MTIPNGQGKGSINGRKRDRKRLWASWSGIDGLREEGG